MKRVLVLAAALFLAACPGHERQQLEQEAQRLRQEREKRVRIAENLDGYRAEVARLEEDALHVESMGSSLSHEDRIKRATAIPGIASKRVYPNGPGTSMSPWELTGSGAALFETLRLQDGALAVDKITFTPPTWVVSVPAWDPNGPYAYTPPVAVAAMAPQPTPEPGRFETKRTQALRREIDMLQKEIAELDRLVGEVAGFEAKRASLQQSLASLETPSRLNRLARLARPLFLGDAPVCSRGSLAVATQSVRYWCAPVNPDLDAASAALREKLTALGDWKLGTVSLDEGATEPIQGTLTPGLPDKAP